MNSIRLTNEQYNYLIAVPAMRRNLSVQRTASKDRCFFVGNDEEIADMRLRLKGLSW